MFTNQNSVDPVLDACDCTYMLSICRLLFLHSTFVSVPVNLALGRPTFMSRVRSGRGASLAVDGNRNPDSVNVGSCCVTEATPKPWWAVDLGAIFNVKEVAISQRDDFRKLNIGRLATIRHTLI